VVEAARLLDDACVALCDGQYRDIGFEQAPEVSLEQYETMIAGKTAALLGASAGIGALAGGAPTREVAAFRECGRRLGMAFQVQDDVLGTWGDAETTGKPVGDDIRGRKKSFPVVHALATLPRPERQRLLDVYARTEITDADVREALVVLDAAGAREASRVEATRWASAAIDAVREVAMPDERRADLEALAAFFVQRSS